MARRCIARVFRGTVASWAGGERAEQVGLREEFEEVTGADWALFHKVLACLAVKARAHEDVQYIVDNGFDLLSRFAGVANETVCEVRVAAVVVIRPTEQSVRVRVTAGPDDVMNTPAELIETVPVEGVVTDST